MKGAAGHITAERAIAVRFQSAFRVNVMIGVCLLATARPSVGLAADDPEPWLRPYAGPTRTDIDATTLDGKVLCGYQGWFNTPGDGTNFGFTHWGRDLERPDGGARFTVDMWPDVTEYDPQDLHEVPGLKMPDGSPARLYSAFRKGPVLLHCRWMRQYGIDGVFLSRFIGEATNPARSRHVNQVLANVREGCHREGRVWAMMLDLSTGRNASTDAVMNDWKFLCDKVKVREDSRYLHHQGKPVVLLWGLGFKDRPWTPEQGEELVHFFKTDPTYGGVYLIGGVDPYWRTLRGASRTDAAWARSTGRSTRSVRGTPVDTATTPRWTASARRCGKPTWPNLRPPARATCRRRFPASRGTT